MRKLDTTYHNGMAGYLMDFGFGGFIGYGKGVSVGLAMYNDLVMVFFHSEPTDEELCVGPITVTREMLNDWHSAEK